MDESFQGFLFWVCRVSFPSGRQNDRRILSCRGQRWTSVSCMGFLFRFFWVAFLWGIEMKESLQGFLFWIFKIFFSLRERWDESFRDSFSGFSGYPFL
jgi:hypothetical protein